MNFNTVGTVISNDQNDPVTMLCRGKFGAKLAVQEKFFSNHILCTQYIVRLH